MASDAEEDTRFSADYDDDLNELLYFDVYNEGVDAALDDCNLSADDFQSLIAPASESWNDFPSTEHPAVVTMDQSKSIQWILVQDEINHLKKSIRQLLGTEMNDEPTVNEIVLYIIGPDSAPGRYLMQELSLSKETYFRFMCNFLIQSAYQISVTSLYSNDSLLKSEVAISKAEYLSIWKKIVTLKELPSASVSTSRREEPIWQAFEEIVNKMLKEISVNGRDGRISIALDDDKIWLNCTNSNMR